ncbi:hypothetical protein GGD38_007648 [Chitinophagaceae bacterium OAS944]|nr:hypothetical protein [Chitinophagaceae bacterium OAS944]
MFHTTTQEVLGVYILKLYNGREIITKKFLKR